MPPDLETHADKWAEIPETSLTRRIYQQHYRVETPDDGMKLVESMDEVRHYLEMYYGDA